MENFVNTLGKELAQTLLDSMIIRGRFDNEEIRKLMIKQGLIKKTTKTIHCFTFHLYQCRSITIKNGRGTYLYDFRIKNEELQEAYKYLS